MTAFRISLAAAGLLLAAAPAMAQSGFYVRGDIGGSFSAATTGNILSGTGFGNDFGSAASFGGGAGLYIPMPGWPVSLRADLTGAYRTGYEADHSGSLGSFTLSGKTKVDVATVLATVYADIPTGTPFTPYLGFGIGAAINSLDRVTYSFNGVPSASEAGTTRANFAWTGGVGVAYAVSPMLTLDVGYRYLDAGEVRTSGTVQVFGRPGTNSQPALKSDLTAHEITVGLRYNF